MIQLVTSTTFMTLTLITLVTAKYVRDIFGWYMCTVFWTVVLVHSIELAISGLGMAFFRLMLVRFPLWAYDKIGQWNLVGIVLAFESTILT